MILLFIGRTVLLAGFGTLSPYRDELFDDAEHEVAGVEMAFDAIDLQMIETPGESRADGETWQGNIYGGKRL